MGNEWKDSLKVDKNGKTVMDILQENRKKIALFLTGVAAAGIGLVTLQRGVDKKDYNENISSLVEILDTGDYMEIDGEREFYVIDSEEKNIDLAVWSDEIQEALGITQEEFELMVNYYNNPDYSMNDRVTEIINKISNHEKTYIQSQINGAKKKILQDVKTLEDGEIDDDLITYIDNQIEYVISDDEVCELIRNGSADIELFGHDTYIRVVPTRVGDIEIPEGKRNKIYSITMEEFKEITGMSWEEYKMCIDFCRDDSSTRKEFNELLGELTTDDEDDREI